MKQWTVYVHYWPATLTERECWLAYLTPQPSKSSVGVFRVEAENRARAKTKAINLAKAKVCGKALEVKP